MKNFITLKKFVLKIFVYHLWILIVLTAITVLIGWHFDIMVLKTCGLGAIAMKPNAAALFLLSGLTLLLLQHPQKIAKYLSLFFSSIIFSASLITLSQYVFNYNLGIDEILYRVDDRTGFLSNPSRMAANAALNFVLLGMVLFFLTLKRAGINFFIEFCVVAAFSISVVGLLSFVFNFHDSVGAAGYSQMAFIAAAAFIVLCAGIFFTIRRRFPDKITIEQKLFAGLTTSAVIIAFISLLSVSSLRSMHQAADAIENSHTIKNQIEDILTSAIDLETGARGFVITGEEEFLEPMIKAGLQIDNQISAFRKLTADNPFQLEAINKMELLITERVRFSELQVNTRKTEGLAATVALTGTGKGLGITDSIRELKNRMIAKENQLLALSDKTEEKRFSQTRNVIRVGLFFQFLLLFLMFVFVKKDISGKNKAEKELRTLNEELEFRVQQRTAELIQSEKKYRDMVEMALIGVYTTTLDGKVLFVNDAIIKMMEVNSVQEFYSTSILALYKNPDDRKRLIKLIQERGFVDDFEAEVITRKGNVITVFLSAKLENNTLTGMIMDITERKKAEEEIKRANRVFNVLSNINKTIVRVKDKQTLFDEACRIAVDDGKFCMAWIGMVDEQTNKFLPVASAGYASEYIKTTVIDLNDPVFRDGIIGRCIRTGGHYLANDNGSDPEMVPCRENGLKLGNNSSAAFPITVFGKTIGAYLIYAEEKFFFDETEVRLLDELAIDISFALEVIENESVRKQNEKELEASEKRFHSTLENMIEGCQMIGFDWRYLFINKAAEKQNGRSREEMLGNIFMDMWPGIVDTNVFVPIKKSMEERIAAFWENEFTFPDGRKGWFKLNIEPIPEGILILSEDITERRLVEEKIAQTEKRFRSLIEQGNDIIAMVDETGKIKYTSPSIKTILGYSDEEFDGVDAFQFIHQDDLENIQQLFADIIINPGKPVTTEMRVHAKSGSFLWLEIVAVNQFENPNLKAIVATARDITGRKVDEESLRESQELFRRTLELGVVGMATTHPETYYFLSVNQHLCNMIGYTEEELLQMTWAEITFPKEKVDEDAANVEKLLSGELNGYVMEKQYRHKDGHMIDITLSVQGLRKKDGTIDYILILIDDITERKAAEKLIITQRDLGAELNAITEINKLWQVSLDALHKVSGMECGGIYLFDKEFQNLDMVYSVGLSQQFIDATAHYSQDSENVKFVRHANPAFIEYNQLPVPLGEIELNENLKSLILLPLINKDVVIGSINLASHQCSNLPVSQQKGIETIVVLIANALERIKIEEEIRMMNAELEQKVNERTIQLAETNDELSIAKAEAERANLAKSEFLSRMSHELRTPLNSILGFAQLINMGELTPAHQKGIDHILKSGRHLLNLINEVLDLSRIEAGRMTLSLEPVLLSGIVSETLDVIKPLAAEKNITIDFPESPACNLYVKADRMKIKQVLLNLVGNAVKYNREGGSVKVECDVRSQKPEDLRQETVDWQLQTEFQTIRISITDTGRGIDPSEIHKLFIPFQRIGDEISEIEGTGLGLAVAKKLVEAMNGAIGVDSEIGGGSTFWIEMPQAQGQKENLKLKGDFITAETASIVSGTLLYIEDNVSNIQLVEQILEMHRPHIRLISEIYGKRTVNLAIDYKPDMILLDLDLPDIHGSEVMNLLKREDKTKSIPVVILSADAMKAQIDRLMQVGAINYLTKPLDVVEFLNVLDEVMKKNRLNT